MFKGSIYLNQTYYSRAQYLDLVYSQSDTLYDLIPNAPRPSNDPSRPSTESHVDGLIYSVKPSSSGGHHGSSAIPPTSSTTSPSSQSHAAQSSEVNAVQSSSSQISGGKKANRGKNKAFKQQDTTKIQSQQQQPGGKKKTKGKTTNSFTPQENIENQQTIVETSSKMKSKFPCMICGEDHYTKDCPHHEEVNQFLKGSSQLVVQHR